MRKGVFILALILMLATVFSGSAWAITVWGNNASFANVYMEALDSNTGNVLDQFLLPNAAAAADNGRGVAVLGNTLYYSVAGSGNIWLTQKNAPHTDLGVLVNTGLRGVSTIATDGSLLYLTEYFVNSNLVHVYDLAGASQGTIALGGAFGTANQRDGFEVIPGVGFVANRGDAVGPYDLYDLSGNLLTAAFINPSSDGIFDPTGIAFDGANFYVSDIHSNRLGVYDSAGAFQNIVNLGLPQPPSGYGRLLEDLAVEAVPEPATLLLIGTGLVGLVGLRRRFRA